MTTIHINASRTVRDLAVEFPAATPVLEKLGIDYCCGGDRSIGDACEAAGIKPVDLARQIGEAQQASIEGETDWQTKPVSELISHIIAKHHVFTRKELERIPSLLTKVCEVHGANHPELQSIQLSFMELAEDLSRHMLKEERVLFPYVVSMEDALEKGGQPPPAHFGTVENPIRMMMSEHDIAGDILKGIRRQSGDFALPETACVSYQMLYQALETLESDLHQHIHLENNILFPKAIQIEKRALACGV